LAYQAACAETLKQVCALVFRELEEVWCGWIEGQWGVGRGILSHKIRLKNEAGANSTRVWLLRRLFWLLDWRSKV